MFYVQVVVVNEDGESQCDSLNAAFDTIEEAFDAQSNAASAAYTSGKNNAA